MERTLTVDEKQALRAVVARDEPTVIAVREDGSVSLYAENTRLEARIDASG